jgi:hypothetical protein
MAKGLFRNLKGVDAFGKVRNIFHLYGEHDTTSTRPLKMSRSKRAQALSVSLQVLGNSHRIESNGHLYDNSHHVVRCYHPRFYDY